jgi:hypothetical protein
MLKGEEEDATGASAGLIPPIEFILYSRIERDLEQKMGELRGER